MVWEGWSRVEHRSYGYTSVMQIEDNQQWAESQFAACELGDSRRTKRLVRIAERTINNPDASMPQQHGNWADLKAAYRLFDCPDVTFDAVAQPHWQCTRQRPVGRYLIISDTTEIDFTSHPYTSGLGPIGGGTTRGFLLHNALMVEPTSQEVVGLAGQLIHYRKNAPKNESRTARMKRERESQIWGTLVDRVGTPEEGVQYVHIFDRGGDDFEAFCHMKQAKTDWVVRASRLNRKVFDEKGKRVSLREAIEKMPVVGTYDLELRTRPKKKAHTAQLEVRIGKVRFPKPQFCSPYVKQLDPQPIEMNVVWVRQVNAKKGKKPIEWVLLTSLGVETFEDALQVIEYYELRWLVEDFHKSLKTGCNVDSRQLQDTTRLEPLVALLSVAAVRLLQLKTIARHDRERKAAAIVPSELLLLLTRVRPRLKRELITVDQFIREVAKLGGFIGRKSDGDPGWQTIWRGWRELQLLRRGFDLARTPAECG